MFSIARRVIVAAVSGQVLLAAGLVLVAARYAGAQVAMVAGLAALAVLLVANVLVIRTVRRGLEPLHELAARADEISAEISAKFSAEVSVKPWNFGVSHGHGLAKELLPLSEALEATMERVQTAFHRQREFTSDTAHELKTSVAIVKSAMQLLLQRPRTQREYEIGLEELLEDCARLEDLLERMLRLARLDQLAGDGARPQRASVDLAATCHAAVARIRTLAEERGVDLDLEASASVLLPADPEDLELIWVNLLENAVQNSPPGSTVTLRVRQLSSALAQVSVLDCGQGIAPADLPHIFERFRRGDSNPTRTTHGFGLGLAICKAAIDVYGGTIEAANLPAGGAEFRVSLPLAQY